MTDKAISSIEQGPIIGKASTAAEEDAYIRSQARLRKLTLDQFFDRYGGESINTRNGCLVGMMAAFKPKRVLEFAAACGFLAELAVKCMPDINRYLCTNFSPLTLRYMRKQLQPYKPCLVVDLNADVTVNPTLNGINLGQFDVFVTTSMEHLEHDVELIASLPKGKPVVFSTSGFNSATHCRFMDSVYTVRKRFLPVMHLSTIVPIPHGKHVKYCVAGKIR